MTTDSPDLAAQREVEQYLADVAEAMADAPATRRTEVQGELRAHVEAELGELPGSASVAEVREVLTRLGPPAAYAEPVPYGAPPAAAPAAAATWDAWLIGLGVLGLLFLISVLVPLVVGIVLVTASFTARVSRRWLVRGFGIGVLLAPVLFVVSHFAWMNASSSVVAPAITSVVTTQP